MHVTDPADHKPLMTVTGLGPRIELRVQLQRWVVMLAAFSYNMPVQED